MPSGNIIVGLDIGTTFIRTVIAEVDEEGTVHIIGLGEVPSEGLRRGVIVNLSLTVEAIRRSVEEAERMADITVDSVYVGVASEHIKGINSHATVSVGRDDQGITQEDVERVIEHATAITIPPDLEIIHVITQDFVVDREQTVKSPVGLTGERLEGEVHIVTAGLNTLRNLRRAVETAGLGVAGIVLEPLAASLAVLTDDERDLGVAVLDIGGGTSDVAVFNQENIRHTAVIALGGVNVTRDVAQVLAAPMREAERLKVEFGCAMVSLVDSESLLDVPRLGGAPAQQIHATHLAEIIEARMQEMFGLVYSEIIKTDWGNLLASGIVLTGGGAMLAGATDLAEEVFDMPVKVGYPRGVLTVTEKIHHPMYATAVGLVLYGSIQESADGPQSKSGRDLGGSRADRIKRWFRELL